MKRGNLIRIALLAILLLAVSVYSAGKTVTLKLNLQKGQSYGVKMVMDQFITQTLQGQKMEITQNIAMGYVLEVMDRDQSGNMKVKVTYKTISFRSKTPMVSLEYDSEKQTDQIDPSLVGYAALVGKSYTMTFTPAGHVLEVGGINEMIDEIISKLELPDEEMKNSVKAQMQAQFGEESIRESMENAFAIYPEKEVKKGSKWKKRIIMSKGFPMIVDTIWKLKSRVDGISTLEVASKVKPNPDAAPLDLGIMKMSYTVSGKQGGTIEVDEDTGWTLRAKIIQNISGTVKMEGQQNMEWPMTIKSTMEYEPLK